MTGNDLAERQVDVDVVGAAASAVRRIFNCLPSQNTEQDWGFVAAAAAGEVAAGAPLPLSVDLREGWWEIGDQRATGSCVGWAVADGLLRWHFVKTGRLPKQRNLSVRYVWMAAKETDEFSQRPTTFIEADGTSLKAALDIARKYGVVESGILPFSTSRLYEDQADVFYIIASRLRVAHYIYLNRDLSQWRSWLAQRGPIVTRLDVDTAFEAAAQSGGHLDHYQHPGYPKGHAVSIVGYTQDGFIVRNSWGRTWGDQGFAYASDNYAQAAFTEAYGVVI